MRVEEIWRYPVKGLRGERLPEVRVLPAGLEGDRAHALLRRRDDGHVRPVPGPAPLRYAATHRPGAAPLVRTPDGTVGALDDATLLAQLRAELGPFEPDAAETGRYLDEAPVQILGRASVEAHADRYGAPLDPLRYRMNFLADLGEPFAEEAWLGRDVRIGEVVLHAESRCVRCVVTTIDPETLEGDPQVLRLLAQTRDACLGVLCRVVRPGVVRQGDVVEPVEAPANRPPAPPAA